MGFVRLNPDDSFDVGKLVSAAMSATGLTDLGSRSCIPALERLLVALDTEACLTERGRGQMGRNIVARLVQRLYMQQQSRDVAAIADIAIERPVLIVGLPRTGSTFAHRLLGQHPELGGLALWELLYPATPPGKTTHDLIRETRTIFSSLFRQFPEFRSIHDIETTAVDECRWLLKGEFQDVSEALLEFDVPDYVNHLMKADLTGAYQGHRRQLQHIMWRQPRPGCLLLKNPGFFWNLQEILDVYPDARLIVLHRDPVQAVASSCSLRENAQRMTGSIDVAAIGSGISRATACVIEKFLNFHKRSGNEAVILDVRYTDLVDDPLKFARDVFDFLDLPVGVEILAGFETFVHLNPQHRHGRHSYDLEKFGLNPTALSSHFTEYTERFLPG